MLSVCGIHLKKTFYWFQGTLGIPGEFGFLKKNELFVGRVAMLGFAAELVGEVSAAMGHVCMLHKGILGLSHCFREILPYVCVFRPYVWHYALGREHALLTACVLGHRF